MCSSDLLHQQPVPGSSTNNYIRSQVQCSDNLHGRQPVSDNSTDDYIRHHYSNEYCEPRLYYENKLIDGYYQWSIVSNHPHNLEQTRLQVLNKILYLELDLEKYSLWLVKSKEYFPDTPQWQGRFQQSTNNILSSVDLNNKQLILSYPITEVISMTHILDSQQGFLTEYQKACEILNITPVIPEAVEYYNNWCEVRVNHLK